MARKILSGLFVVILVVSPALLSLSCAAGDSQTLEERFNELYPQEGEKIMQWSSFPKMVIDVDKKYTATIETEKGNLVLELFAKDVPNAVNNFVFLALQGYYDGVTFHRVIPGFMAQSGDPTGTGFGGPGYSFANEITSHKHVVGALSMGNKGRPNTNESQFFICYVDLPGLDGRYSVFGQLIEGMDVLLNITPRDPAQNPQFTGDKIITVKITEE